MTMLSIVVATFNNLAELKGCLQSITSQSYKDIAVVVIDGASTDGTIEFLNSCGENISFLSEPDNGIFDAMNKGILKSESEWIMFLGADDRFVDNEVLSNVFSDGSPGASYSLLFGTGFAGDRKLRNSFDWRMLKGNSLNHQCVIYRRSILVERLYDTRFSLAADYKLNLSLYWEEHKALNMCMPICNFGINGVSSTHYLQGRAEEQIIRREIFGKWLGFVVNASTSVKNIVSDFLKNCK